MCRFGGGTVSVVFSATVPATLDHTPTPMTRFFPLLAALLFAGAAFAQDTPVDSSDMVAPDMEATADTTEPAITYDPDRSRELATQADALFASDDFAGALELYTQGYSLDSTYAKNPFGQARSYVGLKQLSEAMTAYRKAIELGEGTEGMANVVAAARRERRAIEESMAAQQDAQAIADKITRATAMLQAEPLSESAATTAYGLLEEARMADYDSSQVAFYYAKALNAMGRPDDAIHYAQMAVEQSEGQADRSAFYIQLGLAQMGADNEEAAREAFTAAKTGAWSAWAEHYLAELDKEAAPMDETGG